MTVKPLRLVTACLLLLHAAAFAVDSALLTQAKQLIDAGRAQQAYDLLEPHEADAAGSPDFDYLLGLAALDSGRNTEAIFALQRAVDIDPNHGPARVELARAYMLANETDAAKRELETARNAGVPNEVESVLESYLAEINRYHGAYRTSFSRYIAAGAGFSTNANSATDRTGGVTPVLGGFTLASSSQELDSKLVDIAAGFTFSSPLGDGLRLVGGVDFDHQLTLSDADFSRTQAAGHVGAQYTRGADQFSLIAQADKFFVDGVGIADSDRELAGLTARWKRVLTPETQVSLFAQGAMVRYPEQRVRDVNRYAAGLGVAHALPDLPGAPVLFASVFGGTENPLNDRTGVGLGCGCGRQFGREFVGGRVGGQRNLGARGTLYGSFTYQYSDYDAPDPLFLEQREEDFFEATVGYRWRLDRNWSLNPELRYTNNDANIILNDFDRVELMFTVRNDF